MNGGSSNDVVTWFRLYDGMDSAVVLYMSTAVTIDHPAYVPQHGVPASPTKGSGLPEAPNETPLPLAPAALNVGFLICLLTLLPFPNVVVFVKAFNLVSPLVPINSSAIYRTYVFETGVSLSGGG